MKPINTDSSSTSLAGTSSSSVSTSTITSTSSSIPASSVTSSSAQLVFRDQLGTISHWFDQWNECEQTVALYSLLNKLSPTQSRFLSYSLQHVFASNEHIQRQEHAANNPAFVSRLRNESKENVLVILLSHLPLLRPGNEECKALYLSFVTKILAHSVANATHLEESRQLLSYTLMHPALSLHDRRVLTSYLRNLDDLLNPNNAPHIIKDISKHSTYQYTNGGANYHNQQNGFSFSDNELFTTSNNFMNTWDAHTHVANNIQSNNGQSMPSAPLSPFGSNSLPSGIIPSHMTLQGINTCQSLLSNGVNNGNHIQPQNISIIQQNRLRRSNSLTPSTNGIAPIASIGSLINGNNCGVMSSLRPQSFLSSGAGTSLMVNHLSNNINHNHQQDWSMTNGNNGNGNNCDSTYKLSKNDDKDIQHYPLSPQHSIASSGSGSGSENCLLNSEPKCTFDTPGSGMKDVPAWLKCLRLHKYASLFTTMTYEQMLKLTEQELEKLSVTKGARHKIILNINKLKDRPQVLRALEKDLLEEGVASLRQTLIELKNIIATPIKAFNGSHKIFQNIPCVDDDLLSFNNNSTSNNEGAFADCDNNNPNNLSDDDLPGLLTHLLGKVYDTVPNVSSQMEDECLTMFIIVIDKCLAHEAFNAAQKRRLFIWKQKVQGQAHNLPHRRSLDGRLRGKWGHNVSSMVTNALCNKSASNSLTSTAGSVTSRKRTPSSSVSCSNGGLSVQSQSSVLSAAMITNNNTPEFLPLNPVSRPNLIDHLKSHAQVCRTHSAPVRRNHLSSSVNNNNNNFSSFRDSDREQLNDIETLCIRMTEQALGPDGGLSY